MTGYPNLTLVDHPLIQHKLSYLRSVDTPKKGFKELTVEISMLMAYEATRDLPLEEVTVDTPLETTAAKRIKGKKLVVVPILRAGLGMVEGIVRLIPSARVGHVGLYRDEHTLLPVEYYCKLPAGPDVRDIFILDPMLATGGSAVMAVRLLKARGAQRLNYLCVVASPEGVQKMLDAHPDVRIYAAALDRELNDQGYILPGLGDAGDRLFGTK